MTKSCQQCGRTISSDDWYAFIRMKYCRACAAEIRRRQKAAWAKELRRKTRERNALTRELCRNQQREIALLRMEVQRQRERADLLEQEMYDTE